eukprot:TRINITY_DN39189_c0_g1_i1.p1 TRINITY_DN39189_c0_g1~~TRINITY_DN39189_c0_g1_i1.p1  ORF type:complete len:230 (+),score=71.40 TRINITY_DN39189_c0_g1_i1:80-691(+)
MAADPQQRWAQVCAACEGWSEDVAFQCMLDSPATRRHLILPPADGHRGVWLGNQVAAGGMVPLSDRTAQYLAECKAELQRDGVTHILCFAEELCVFPDDFAYHQIRIADHESSELTPHFAAAFAFIDAALASGGGVLVHCNAGISRSPSLVIAWLMGHLGVGFDEAALTVLRARPCANPVAFLGELLALEGPRGEAAPAPGAL